MKRRLQFSMTTALRKFIFEALTRPLHTPGNSPVTRTGQRAAEVIGLLPFVCRVDLNEQLGPWRSGVSI